ncbi:glycoside hydrolase 43 family protein [Sphingobacterium sp. JB170]|uniref:glycoside hydrolase family 43 protein n=1 Tax=Sphingobacterium sp. JB170 TaxID=1434842 RepID=UPI00097F6151|nr:glycoside hydrolase 43 family protein [Sphingobacterium sp. JB170]SJN23260.1 Beta-xylosidase [Sphingobacterium sp. JB170]
MNKIFLSSAILFVGLFAGDLAAQQPYVSSVWVADQGDGTYQNPILHADYSDPDVVRVGNDYYMVASSFNHAPGLPLLHSKDLVNWKIVNHVLARQRPLDVFASVQHGNGVWAPAIRHHEGTFYVYYPDPDYGIYMTSATDPEGAWSEPILVFPGKGLIDPCPFWDEDGNNYLAYAYAGSRAGIKSVLAIARLNQAGTKVLDDGQIVYDGHELDPTVEGPKVYKRGGYYYLFAPAGGVSTGWQLVLRSKNIYGPYERKVVMEQGSSPTNGPHQGAWVDTNSGEDWFIHFQDKEAYGRIVHLQPMKWVDDWPVIGLEQGKKGTGEPVLRYKKPNVSKIYPRETPAESDEFSSPQLGLQWQWQANPEGNWLMASNQGNLVLYTQQPPNDGNSNLLDMPHILTQKFPAESFQATTKIQLVNNDKIQEERAGFAVVGEDYSQLYIKSENGKQALYYGSCKDALTTGEESSTRVAAIDEHAYTYLRVQVRAGGLCSWSYSTDGKTFTPAGQAFTARAGKWIGATLGLYSSRDTTINDSGYARVDWFRIEPLN